MAKTFKTGNTHEPLKKRTQSGGKIATSGMNKNKKRTFKKYRGQGK